MQPRYRDLAAQAKARGAVYSFKNLFFDQRSNADFKNNNSNCPNGNTTLLTNTKLVANRLYPTIVSFPHCRDKLVE